MVPPWLPGGKHPRTTRIAITGIPGPGYYPSPARLVLSQERTGEFDLLALRVHLIGLPPHSPDSLADDLLLLAWPFVKTKSGRLKSFFSGPRGIRTPGLLNAIETRSQLRYGPICSTSIGKDRLQEPVGWGSAPSGPEGIRTPDLFSAIEARSQLRYRPLYEVARLYSEAW